MAELYRCATCGNVLSETLGGQCPACLLKGGLAASAAETPGSQTVPYQPKPDESAPPPATPMPSAGQEFGGYYIVRALGQGGMGAVFEAEERDTGRRLALKVLSHSFDSPQARQRFLREGRLAASVNHPHSVYVFGTEEIDGAPVITMELVQGGTLQDRVRSQGPLPIQDAVDAVLQVVEGLEAAQAVGVLHRDVKPSNCFVDSDGRVKIGDFGLSISTVGRGDLQLTGSGVILGTPKFASPEQLRGDELDQRSDLYAVGGTLFYLLTGRVPFEADTMVRLVAKVLEKPAPAVRSLRPEVPRELATVLHRCLAKEPSWRYRGYADLRSALLPFGSLLPSPASPSRRFLAGCIDLGVLTFLINLFVPALAFFGITQLSPFQLGFGKYLWMYSWSWSLYLIYYILPEGLWQATLGKRILGIRVVLQGQRQQPGIWRAAVRTLVFCGLPSLPFLLSAWAYPDLVAADGRFLQLTESSIARLMAPMIGTLIFFGLLFVTMRRSNGYAGLHDFCSGTRVIARPTAPQRPILSKPDESLEEVKLGLGSETPATPIGPFQVLGNLGTTAAGDWHLGYDPRLFRKVWLCVVFAGTPRLPAARQNVARPGRLRWLAGRRGPQENWDAYESPTGQALWQLLGRPHDWSHVGFWLHDLSEELASALKDDTLPATLGLEQVWITADGRAILLDQEAPGLQVSAGASISTQPGDVEPVKGFLHHVAVSTLRGRRIGYGEAQADALALPLPLHVRPIVDGLKKVQRPEVAAAQIQATLAKPTRVTKTRRAALLACCVGIPLLFATLVVLAMVAATTSTTDPTPDPTPELIDIQNALQWHSPIIGWATEPTDLEEKAPYMRFRTQTNWNSRTGTVKTTSWFNPATVEEKKALEIYLAGTHRDRINDPATWTDSYLAKHGGSEQRMVASEVLAREILARTPPPTDEEFKKALTIVGPTLDMLKRFGPPVSFPRVDLNDVFIGVFTIYLGLLIAFPSVLCALLFRGGLLWWMFRISAVTKNGQPVGRLRLFARSVIAWSPIILFASLAFIHLLIWLPLWRRFFDQAIVPILLFAIYAAVALLSTLTGKRGWPDRLAGTWLVIR